MLTYLIYDNITDLIWHRLDLFYTLIFPNYDIFIISCKNFKGITPFKLCSINLFPTSCHDLQIAFLGAQPKTRKFQQVCRHLATDLLSTSRYQDAFAYWLKATGLLTTDLLQVVNTFVAS